AASIDPNHDRQFRIGILSRGPHVEIQTIFAEIRRRAERVRQDWVLHAARRERISFFNSAPGLYGLRRFPPEIPHWRRGKGNALERGYGPGRDALHFAAAYGCRLNLRESVL